MTVRQLFETGVWQSPLEQCGMWYAEWLGPKYPNWWLLESLPKKRSRGYYSDTETTNRQERACSIWVRASFDARGELVGQTRGIPQLKTPVGAHEARVPMFRSTSKNRHHLELCVENMGYLRGNVVYLFSVWNQL